MKAIVLLLAAGALTMLSGSAGATLLGASDVETACADVPARNCFATGQVTWRLPRAVASECEFTGDWQWCVNEGDFDAGGVVNDLQVFASRGGGIGHPQVHRGELSGRILSVSFLNAPFAPQAPKADSKQHFGGGHFDGLIASIERANMTDMLIKLAFSHPSAVVAPEPSALGLLAAGVLGLLGWRRAAGGVRRAAVPPRRRG
jgi:hypothetical protein